MHINSILYGFCPVSKQLLGVGKLDQWDIELSVQECELKFEFSGPYEAKRGFICKSRNWRLLGVR